MGESYNYVMSGGSFRGSFYWGPFRGTLVSQAPRMRERENVSRDANAEGCEILKAYFLYKSLSWTLCAFLLLLFLFLLYLKNKQTNKKPNNNNKNTPDI
jgi:hypothetical protein